MQRLLLRSSSTTLRTCSQSRLALASYHAYASNGNTFPKHAIRQASLPALLLDVNSKLLVSRKHHIQLHGFSSASSSVDHENPAINNKIRAGKVLFKFIRTHKIIMGLFYFIFTDPSKPVIVLFDAHALIFRAFHAIPPMNRKDGTPTNAVFGFMR